MKKLTHEERVRQRMPKPKRPSRKFVLIEVETTLSNAHLSDYVQLNLNDTGLGDDNEHSVLVFQCHVNAAKKEKAR